MSLHDATPTAVVEHCAQMIEDGNLEALLAHYHPDIVFAMSPDRVVRGVEAAKNELAPFFEATDAKMVEYSLVQALEFEDIAIVSYRTRFEGIDPSGHPIKFEGINADVLRRDPDGKWVVIIDNPRGGSLSSLGESTV